MGEQYIVIRICFRLLSTVINRYCTVLRASVSRLNSASSPTNCRNGPFDQRSLLEQVDANATGCLPAVQYCRCLIFSLHNCRSSLKFMHMHSTSFFKESRSYLRFPIFHSCISSQTKLTLIVLCVINIVRMLLSNSNSVLNLYKWVLLIWCIQSYHSATRITRITECGGHWAPSPMSCEQDSCGARVELNIDLSRAASYSRVRNVPPNTTKRSATSEIFVRLVTGRFAHDGRGTESLDAQPQAELFGSVCIRNTVLC